MSVYSRPQQGIFLTEDYIWKSSTGPFQYGKPIQGLFHIEYTLEVFFEW